MKTPLNMQRALSVEVDFMIHRSKHKKNYLAISNETAREAGLSDSAFRLLIFMLSNSDDWQFSVKGISSALEWEERKTLRVIAELKRSGHLVINKLQDKSGHFGSYEWHLYEEPQNTELQISPNSVKNRTRNFTELGKKPNSVKNVAIRKTKYIYKKDQIDITKTKDKEEEKNALGEFSNVFLSDSEFKKLEEKLGAEKRDSYIESLGDYLKTHPKKKYASHYRTILKWSEGDAKKAKAGPVVNWNELMAQAEEMDRKKAGGNK